ncbi:MAG: FadR/GntR family transcriptional regulator [Candidatus Limivicinus sp.]
MRKVNVSKLVQEQIICYITSGELNPGDKLPSERAFCEKLEVGRSSVREAIEGLVVLGVLTKTGSGVYVRDYKNGLLRESMNVLIDMQQVTADELIEARIATESQIVRLATKKATPEDIQELEQIIASTDNAQTLDAVHAASAQFHYKLAQMTHNPILINMFCTLYEQINKFPRKNYQTITTHVHILELIKAGNADGAEKAMVDHLINIRKSVVV